MTLSPRMIMIERKSPRKGTKTYTLLFCLFVIQSLKESPQERGRKQNYHHACNVFGKGIERKSPRKGTKTIVRRDLRQILGLLKESPQERGRKPPAVALPTFSLRRLKESPQERGRKRFNVFYISVPIPIERKSPRKGTKTVHESVHTLRGCEH